MELSGKKVIITGGVRGLGKCMVAQFVEKEAAVTVVDINSEGLNDLKKEFSSITTYTCDLTNYDQVAEITYKYFCEFGSADVLINNAGILYSAPLVKISPTGIEKHDIKMWNTVIQADLSSIFYMTTCIVEKMVTTRKKGVIANISSVSAAGNAGQSAYSAAKAGVNALTATWAKELSTFGIRVFAVAPGFIETDSTREAVADGILKDIVSKVPLRRLGKPEEVASTVLFGIKNDFINGKILQIDGGLVI